MRWPWTSTPAAEPVAVPSPAAATPPAPAPLSRAWASLPAIQRSAADVSLSRPDAFAAGLGVRQVPPMVLAPLGHDVVLGAPSGLVDVDALRGAGRASASPGPMPAPVQRRRRRGAPEPATSSPWLSDLGVISYGSAPAEPDVSLDTDTWEPDTALALPAVVTPAHLDAPAAAPVPVLRSALTSRPATSSTATTPAAVAPVSPLPTVVVARELRAAPAPVQRLGGAATPVEPRPLAPVAALDRPGVPVLRSTGTWVSPVVEASALQEEPVRSTFADIPALLAAEATAPAASADAPVAAIPAVARRGIGEPRASLPARVQRQRLSDPDPVSPGTMAFPSVSGGSPEPVSAPLTSAVPLPARDVPLLVSAPVTEAPSTAWTDDAAPALVDTSAARAPLVGATSLMAPSAPAPVSSARAELDEAPTASSDPAAAPGVPSVNGVPLPPELAALVGAATPRGSTPSSSGAPSSSVGSSPVGSTPGSSGPAGARPVPVLRSTSAPPSVSPGSPDPAPLRVLPSVRAPQDRMSSPGGAVTAAGSPAGAATAYDPVGLPTGALPTLTTVARSPLAAAAPAPARPAAVVSRWTGPSASQPQTTLQASSLTTAPASIAAAPAPAGPGTPGSPVSPAVQRAIDVDNITVEDTTPTQPAAAPAAPDATAPAAGGSAVQDPDAMAADLWERIRPMLARDLLLDRERSSLLLDP